MKKFKNYILMLLVPLILLGCVSKGVSEAVTEDTINNNVSVNTTLASKINDNIYLLNSYYETSNSLTSKDYLYNSTSTSIIKYLKLIRNAYNNGDVLESTVQNYSDSMSTLKSDFLKANSLLEYENMVSTYSNIQIKLSALNADNTSNQDDIADLVLIEDEIYTNYIVPLQEMFAGNKYYVELDESIQLDTYLKNNYSVATPSLSYKGLLAKYGVLDNAALADKYATYINMINAQLSILNNTNVITSLDSFLNSTDVLTTKYNITDILTTSQRTDLITQLTNLKNMYADYKNNLSKIASAEYKFYDTEKQYLLAIAASYSYYYRIKMSGTALNIQYIPNSNTAVTTEISIELERIYKLSLTTSNLTPTQKYKIYIIYKNINNMKDMLGDYSSLNPTTIYSACVTTAQLIQVLKDNYVLINYAVKLNN